jgi:hypothetical protein
LNILLGHLVWSFSIFSSPSENKRSRFHFVQQPCRLELDLYFKGGTLKIIGNN